MKRRDLLTKCLAGGLVSGLSPSLLHAADVDEAEFGRRLQGSFIWCSHTLSPAGKQVYLAFRKAFQLPSRPSSATLRIFADTRYVLWINGRYVERGPCRFDPKRPEYDVLEAGEHLQPGQNLIAVLVHYYAVGSFQKWSEQCARMMEHVPGLTIRIDTGDREILATDSTWRLSTHNGHLPSKGSYSSVPDDIDARISADWTQEAFDDSAWTQAVTVKGNQWGRLHPRSIPLLRETTVEHQTVLPVDLQPGKPLVVDLGRAYQIYTVWNLEAGAGSELLIQHGMKEAAGFEQRISRYVARQGRQTYMSTDTFGARYIEIKLKSGSARVLSAKAVDRRYPYTRLGRFDSSDPLLNDIWRLGVQTVELCSEDAYVDCADRERAQWMADGYMMAYPVSRVALAGPGKEPGTFDYCDSRLLRNMLRHMAYSQLPDGRLQPMRPSMYPPDLKHGVIDDYTCLWVQALREVHERTGDVEFAKEVWPTVVKAMNYFLDRRSNRGLVYAQEFLYFKNPLAYQGCEGTTVNCYIYQALRDAGFLGVRLGLSEARFLKASQDLRHAMNDELWDEEAGSYSGGIVNGEKSPPTAHAALIALYNQIVPPEWLDQVYKFLLSHFEQESPFPYTYRYLFDVLYQQNTDAADRLALNTMRKKWQSMTGNVTGAASESWGGYSYMHESGAHPAYFLSAYVLGVRNPARQLIIQPRLGGLERAEGVVVTEFGPVSVSWKFADHQKLTFQIDIPPDVVADVSIPVLSPDAEVVMDDRHLTFPKRARFARKSIGHGPHSGYVSASRLNIHA